MTEESAPRLRLTRWWPLHVTLILIGTWSPYHLGALTQAISGQAELLDTLLNILVFLPLGMALRTRGWKLGFACGLTLSLFAEAGQLLFLRTPCPWDLVANTLGCILGQLLPRVHFDRRGWRAIAVLLLIVAISAGIRTQSSADARSAVDFSEWESAPLGVGGELDADLGFRGLIHRLEIHNDLLDEQALVDILTQSKPLPSAQWTLVVQPRGLLSWSRGLPAPTPLQLPSATAFASDAQGLLVQEHALRIPVGDGGHAPRTEAFDDRLTVIAEVTPSAADLRGETRILTFGSGRWRKNFSLGTLAGEVDWRVRTPVTDRAGNGPGLRSWTSPLQAGARVIIAARFGGGSSRIDCFSFADSNWSPAGQRFLAPLATPSPLGLAGPALVALIGAVLIVAVRLLGLPPSLDQIATLTLPCVVLAWAGPGGHLFAAYPHPLRMLLPSLLAMGLATRVQLASES